MLQLDGFEPMSLEIEAKLQPRHSQYLHKVRLLDVQLPGSYEAAPVYHDGRLLGRARDGELHMVSLETRTVEAKFTTGSLSGSIACPVPTPAGIVLSVYEGKLWMLRQAGELFEARWTLDLKEGIRAEPMVYGNLLIVATEAGSVHAYDLETGTEQWKLTHPDRSLIGSPVILGDRLFLHLSGPQLLAIDLRTQATAFTLRQDEDPIGAIGVCEQGILVTTVTGNVSVLRPDSGEAIWTFAGRGLPTAAVKPAEKTASLALGDRVIQIDMVRHQPGQTWAIDNPLTGAALQVDDMLYVGTSSGQLVGLQAGQEAPVTTTPVGDSAVVGSPVLTPLGIAVLCRDGTLRVFVR